MKSFRNKRNLAEAKTGSAAPNITMETKPTGEGTSLGLSLSYDIITKGHGGEMKVDTKEGEGSKFIIIFKI